MCLGRQNIGSRKVAIRTANLGALTSLEAPPFIMTDFYVTDVNRRKFLAGLGAATGTAVAGCLTENNDTNASATESNRGGLIATIIDQPPEDVTVTNATSGRIGNDDDIQTVISRARANDIDYAMLQLDRERFAAVQSTLSHLPRYTGRNGPSGYYLQYDDQPILLYPFYLNPSNKATPAGDRQRR